jgi:acyl carrier protein
VCAARPSPVFGHTLERGRNPTDKLVVQARLDCALLYASEAVPMMDIPTIKEVVLQALRNANLARPLDEQLAVADDAVIFGAGSLLDSMGLVSLLIDIEDALRAQGVEVSLSDDRAMSQTRSPFRSVPRLVEFISSLVQAG